VAKKFLTVLITIVLTAITLSAVGNASAQANYGSWCANQSDFAVLGASSEVGQGKTGYTGKGPDGVAGTADDGFYEATPYGWTTRLRNSLHAEWGTQMQNYSRGGALVSDFLPGGRWATTAGATADLAAKQTDLAILDLGGNEYLTQVSPATFEANLRTLVTNIKAARADMDVLLIVHHTIKWPANGTPAYPHPTPQWTWTEYASKIGSVAVSTPTALVDARQYIPSLDTVPQPQVSLWAPGENPPIHLGDAGDIAFYSMTWGWTSALASVC
jgi:GDSL-like Lipase/Acylhydrolase family